MVNDTTRLLGLEGLAVVKVDEGVHGPVVHLETADEVARACPECGVRARRVKGWAVTRPRDLPVAGRHTELRWRKRRWFCDERACPRGTFTEQVGQVPARARLTTRLRRAAGAAVADGGRTVVQSARDHRLSWPVVSAALAAHAHQVLPVQVPVVQRLGVDETRRAARGGGGMSRPPRGRRSVIAGMWGLWTCRAVTGCSARSKAAQEPV